MFGGLIVLGLVRRQCCHKRIFNLTLFAAEISLGVFIYRELLGDSSPTGPGAWGAVFIALIAAQLLDVAAVSGAITLYSGWPGAREVRQVLLIATLICIANTSTGLAIAVSIWDKSYIGFLMASIVVALFVLNRAYLGLTERHKSLETLHDFTRQLGGSLEIHELEQAVVQGARTILRGEQGALLLPPIREGESASRLLSTGDELLRTSVLPSELEIGRAHV